jgi:hypothetical protein
MILCSWKHCNVELVNVSGKKKKTKFCSLKCKSKAGVDKRRKKIKLMAVEYKGGKCIHCSYNKCLAALEFHHRDKDKKDFGISMNGNTKSWQRIKDELDKCDLVCSNCHREIHASISSDGATPL